MSRADTLAENGQHVIQKVRDQGRPAPAAGGGQGEWRRRGADAGARSALGGGGRAFARRAAPDHVSALAAGQLRFSGRRRDRRQGDPGALRLRCSLARGGGGAAAVRVRAPRTAGGQGVERPGARRVAEPPGDLSSGSGRSGRQHESEHRGKDRPAGAAVSQPEP